MNIMKTEQGRLTASIIILVAAIVATAAAESQLEQSSRKGRRFNAETQRFAETRGEFRFFAFLRVTLRLCVKFSSDLVAALNLPLFIPLPPSSPGPASHVPSNAP